MNIQKSAKTNIADTLVPRFPPADQTLARMLQAQAELYGDRDLMRMDNGSFTYNEACEIAARSAAGLAEAGVEAGDRVAIICSNRIEFMHTYLGCAWVGAVAVPINVASRGAQLEHILRNCGAKLVVVEPEFADVLLPLADADLQLEKAWVVGDPAQVNLPHLQVTSIPKVEQGIPPFPARPGDMVVILYTSGTTGPSKGVCCPQAQYFWWAYHTASLLEMQEGDVLHSSLPLFHTNALNSFYQALMTGSTLVVSKRFSVSGFLQALVNSEATVTYLLGAMVPMLLSRPAGPDERNHKVRIALAPGVPLQFQDAFRERFGIEIIDGYGSTETNFTIGDIAADRRPGLMGRVRPGFEAKVVDADDNELPDGEAGELVMRADEPFAFATGYFGMPEQTVSTWRNLWFHSGDRVVREADGYFRFLDRTKDAIRRRGENISSFEVEQVVASHPDVSHAAVFPVKSDLAEDEVMVSIILREGAALTPETLLDFCQPLMPYFAVPRYVDIVDTLPTTENGKIQKYKLREQGVSQNTWDREAVGYMVKR